MKLNTNFHLHNKENKFVPLIFKNIKISEDKIILDKKKYKLTLLSKNQHLLNEETWGYYQNNYYRLELN
jgi:hypothetical protein